MSLQFRKHVKRAPRPAPVDDEMAKACKACHVEPCTTLCVYYEKTAEYKLQQVFGKAPAKTKSMHKPREHGRDDAVYSQWSDPFPEESRFPDL